MTTIILTIIGILIAAASALMVAYYGGDAFSGGDIRARAAMFQNAGLNVVSAVRLYRAETGGPTPTIEQLISDGYLIKDPDTPRPPRGDLFSNISTFENMEYYTTPAASAKVCERIENNAGRSYPGGWVEPLRAQGQFGCARLDNSRNLLFYMRT